MTKKEMLQTLELIQVKAMHHNNNSKEVDVILLGCLLDFMLLFKNHLQEHTK